MSFFAIDHEYMAWLDAEEESRRRWLNFLWDNTQEKGWVVETYRDPVDRTALMAFRAGKVKHSFRLEEPLREGFMRGHLREFEAKLHTYRVKRYRA